MIAIQSTKKLQFPPASVGFVKMEIDLIQNKPSEELYELRIVDTCFDNIKEEIKTLNEQGELVKEVKDTVKVFGTNVRFKTYTYAQLKQLATQLNVDFSDNTLTLENINQLFREGLLLITQLECQQGISTPGKGMYFSEAQDWISVQNEKSI